MYHKKDFFSDYLDYSAGGEAPTIFHRWSAIVGLGAWLGRSSFVYHADSMVHPNIYAMLMGASASRKSTAIKLMKRILPQLGYETIAADKTTKEKFLMDLAGMEDEKPQSTILEDNIFGADFLGPREIFVAADEFNDFLGNNIMEFVSTLGNLWDWNGPPYKSRIKNGKSISISDPTVSILGGNTATGFNTAFPPEILGQGFFSRLLLIYGEPTGKKIAFPRKKTVENTKPILEFLLEIKRSSRGELNFSPDAEKLLSHIYKTWTPLNDIRFDSYAGRRFTHLIKLSIIHARAALCEEICFDTVIYANTVLRYAEQFMPKALGEFGKAKNSDITHKILQILDAAKTPITMKEIWRNVVGDLDSIGTLGEMLRNLAAAEKIQSIGGDGFLPKKLVRDIHLDREDDTVNWNLLTKEERDI